ncbi:Bifunctional NMN adenylyltransferase/Nudix hydrolase [Paraconexibacter sp. AEG42_29]|uniref:Bifunctional NMN adenylyltransferase/Nudix hydrolase n=1 Tax=Paraconexibacter sp. AEG42_29 TaxID=2997339 RepID=A0AAU7AYL7_9ACTN
MTFSYPHPRPAMTVDLVVRHAGRVLLIQRGGEPFAGAWAFPGGFVDGDRSGDAAKETVEAAAVRELLEETRVTVAEDDLHLIGVFSAPGRDPRGWTISAAFAVELHEAPSPQASDDARAAELFATDAVPDLAFDHAEILARGLALLDRLP